MIPLFFTFDVNFSFKLYAQIPIGHKMAHLMFTESACGGSEPELLRIAHTQDTDRHAHKLTHTFISLFLLNE